MIVPVLLAVDPGKDCGLAIYKNGALYWAGCHTWPDTEPLLMALADASSPARDLEVQIRYPLTVIAEKPVVYKPGEGEYINPANIVTLAVTLGRWLGYVEKIGMQKDVPIRYVTPADWKRQVPKEVTHARLRRRLVAAELDTLDANLRTIAAGKRHNALDAAALGLFGVGRCLPGVT